MFSLAHATRNRRAESREVPCRISIASYRPRNEALAVQGSTQEKMNEPEARPQGKARLSGSEFYGQHRRASYSHHERISRSEISSARRRCGRHNCDVRLSANFAEGPRHHAPEAGSKGSETSENSRRAIARSALP